MSVPADYFVPDPYNPGAWLVCKDGADQSWIDPADPTRLEFDYMKRITWLVDVWAGARGIATGERLRVVHIGGAGMSLARWLAVARPTSAQIVLEPDEAITRAVREFAPLPRHSGIKVRAVDGRSGIAAMPDDYADVVILDAFDHRQVPSSLVSAEFMGDVRRMLHNGGLLAVNLIDAHPHAWSRRVVATVARQFSATCVVAEASAMKARRVTNLVVGASPAWLGWDGLARRAAGADFPCAALVDDDLTRWLAGAHPFTDADAKPSPARDEGDLTWYG
ncbi:MAG: fused MFS/spermidine synthase [Micrococcales bacterium]|nr:fused MFS/spermidine synthase [Micrococcales bacterium]